ncbi:MAG: IS1182 family transposase [Chloroflexi bacterium]|nr:IS1182 family transposase [Chloroflexota bacterium]
MDGQAQRLRLRGVNRDQVTPVPAVLDGLVGADDLVRLIWAAVELLNLSGFYQGLKVVEGGPGRAAVDPKILVALWLYATTQGVTKARELNRLCVRHLAYMWLCGGVTMNYHTLSDFRVQHGVALDELMTQILGRLSHAGLVEFKHTAQDGIRVRASAGAASFRREATLEQHLAEAKQVVASVSAAQQSAGDDDEGEDRPDGRKRAAQERGAQERVARIEAALAELPAVRATKEKKEQDQARVSTTDPEARVMKMADGGFRPAYNLQFAADTGQRVITGVAVSNVGSDMSQAPAMVEQTEERTGRLPNRWLMDGGFASHASIEKITAQGIEVLAPVPTPRDPARDPYQPLPTDSPVVGSWRERMGTGEVKETYKLRASTIELINAQARGWHGLTQLPVRGLAKVRCIALWIAIAHNLLVGLRSLLGLRPGPVAIAA